MVLGSGAGGGAVSWPANRRGAWTTLRAGIGGQLLGTEPNLWVWTLILTVLGAGIALAQPQLTQIVILIAIAPALIAVAHRSPRTLVPVLALWLVAVGLVRRVLLGLGSRSLLGDPLLLVEPALLVLLTVVALQRGASRNRTLLTKAVVGLNLLALIEVVNPLQGGLTVGLGGLLFVLVPMLAFWVGRGLCDDATLKRLFTLLGLLAIPASVYGLLQTYVGFPSWDMRWIESVTGNGAYAALDVGGVIRAFSSFSSASEYASFLGVGIAVWLAWGRRPGRVPVMLAVVALLGTALVLEASRGVVVLAVLAIGVMCAAVARVRLASAALWGVAALVVLYLGVSHLAPASQATTGSTGTTAALVQHEVGGLVQPLNSQSSTLGAHFSELTSGLKSALTDPIGHGTGTISWAASKFGGVSQGTEVDPSNAAVALGLPGLVAYLLVAVVGLASAYRLAAGRRDWLSVGALGLLMVTLLQWLNGAQYAVAWLPWLILGWVDASTLARRRQEVPVLTDRP
jgi:hypothetical protein